MTWLQKFKRSALINRLNKRAQIVAQKMREDIANAKRSAPPPAPQDQPRIEFSKIAEEIGKRYEIRRLGSKLCFRPSRQGSYRPDPDDRRLASALRSYVDRIGRSDGWHAGIVQDFKSYLLADAAALDPASGDLLSNNPQLID